MATGSLEDLVPRLQDNVKKFTLTQKSNDFPSNLDVNNLGGWKFDTQKNSHY